LALAALGLAVGCTGGEKAAEGGSTEKKLRIAMIPKGTSHEFWKSVNAGAQEAADELGVELIWKGPLKEDDRDEQIKVVEQFTLDKVDGICLAPLDDTALVTYVMQAQDAGIPVLIFDSGLKYDDTVSFVATDNFAAGELAGQEMAKVLLAGSEVIVLRYQVGSASTQEREDGFIDAAGKAGLKVVSKEQYAGATVESAQKASENLIARFKEGDGLGVAGIFCPNESSTFGMLRALQDAGMAGKVRFIGFDASSKLLDGLTAGEVDGLVIQNPRRMGYLAVSSMVEKLKGSTPEKRIDTGAAFVTKENMGTDKMKKLLK
jgi:ribose transport system substrate-binding protein